MRKKIYLIHPSYRDQDGVLLKGKTLYTISLALPALRAAIPPDWEKESCLEYFEDVNLDTDASIVGISSMGYEIFRGIELAAEFKKRGKIVIFGGFQPHISRDLVREHADTVVHGYPGPVALARILADALSGSLSPDYSCETDLDFLFDYSIVDSRRSVFAPVLTSAGCRNACDFCCIGSFFHKRYTLRRLDLVLAEIDTLSKRTHRIAFVDTNLYNDPLYVRRLCSSMIDKGYRFLWGAQATVDIGDDPETLALMQRAGCKLLFIGLETIDQANLDAVHKNCSASSYQRRIKAIHDAGIRIAAFFMFGFDGDTLETPARLSQFIIEQGIALPMLNIVVPLAGTAMYERLRREGRVRMRSDTDFLKKNIAYNSSFNLCFFQPARMSPEELEASFLELLGRLAGVRQILRRSMSSDIGLSLFLLYMNWLFRREYLRLRRAKGHRGSG